MTKKMLQRRRASGADDRNQDMAKYRKTKKGVITSIYNKQASKSKIRNHRLPEYTKSGGFRWKYKQSN